MNDTLMSPDNTPPLADQLTNGSRQHSSPDALPNHTGSTHTHAAEHKMPARAGYKLPARVWAIATPTGWEHNKTTRTATTGTAPEEKANAFTLEAGTHLLLTGNNGSGKTSLLKYLAHEALPRDIERSYSNVMDRPRGDEVGYLGIDDDDALSTNFPITVRQYLAITSADSPYIQWLLNATNLKAAPSAVHDGAHTPSDDLLPLEQLPSSVVEQIAPLLDCPRQNLSLGERTRLRIFQMVFGFSAGNPFRARKGKGLFGRNRKRAHAPDHEIAHTDSALRRLVLIDELLGSLDPAGEDFTRAILLWCRQHSISVMAVAHDPTRWVEMFDNHLELSASNGLSGCAVCLSLSRATTGKISVDL